MVTVRYTTAKKAVWPSLPSKIRTDFCNRIKQYKTVKTVKQKRLLLCFVFEQQEVMCRRK